MFVAPPPPGCGLCNVQRVPCEKEAQSRHSGAESCSDPAPCTGAKRPPPPPAAAAVWLRLRATEGPPQTERMTCGDRAQASPPPAHPMGMLRDGSACAGSVARGIGQLKPRGVDADESREARGGGAWERKTDWRLENQRCLCPPPNPRYTMQWHTNALV